VPVLTFWRRDKRPPEGNRTTLPRTSSRSPVTMLIACSDCSVYVAKEMSAGTVTWAWLLLPSFYSLCVQNWKTAVGVSARTAVISDYCLYMLYGLLQHFSTRIPRVVVRLTMYQRKSFYVKPFVLFYITLYDVDVWTWNIIKMCDKTRVQHKNTVVTESCYPYICVSSSQRDAPIKNTSNSFMTVCQNALYKYWTSRKIC
jgi:hypothetical protein